MPTSLKIGSLIRSLDKEKFSPEEKEKDFSSVVSSFIWDRLEEVLSEFNSWSDISETEVLSYFKDRMTFLSNYPLPLVLGEKSILINLNSELYIPSNVFLSWLSDFLILHGISRLGKETTARIIQAKFYKNLPEIIQSLFYTFIKISIKSDNSTSSLTSLYVTGQKKLPEVLTWWEAKTFPLSVPASQIVQALRENPKVIENMPARIRAVLLGENFSKGELSKDEIRTIASSLFSFVRKFLPSVMEVDWGADSELKKFVQLSKFILSVAKRVSSPTNQEAWVRYFLINNPRVFSQSFFSLNNQNEKGG